MMYVNHNFMGNYLNAAGSGDKKMKRDILISEIAKIVVTRPVQVMKDLSRCGFSVPRNVSRDGLIDHVSEALYKSPKFAHRMAIQILGGSYGADGETLTMMDASPIMAEASTTTTTTVERAPSQYVSTEPVVTGIGETFGGLTAPINPALEATLAPTGSTTTTLSQPTSALFAPTLGSGSGTRTVSPTPTPTQTQMPTGGSPTAGRSAYTGGGSMGGGSMGGGSSPVEVNSKATEELKQKAAVMVGATRLTKTQKTIGFLLLGTAIGVGIYYYSK